MTLSSLHTVTTHKRYRELLAEWVAEQDESEDAREPPKPDAVVLVAFRTRPPIGGEVELFDAPLDDEETDDDENSTPAKSKTAPPARPVPKIAAQRAPEEFMCGVTAQPGRMVVHVPNMTVSGQGCNRRWPTHSSQWKGAGLLHKVYTADLCFGPDAGNDVVYEQAVKAPGLVQLALDGGVACVLAYGQTSAGKTYSMTALELAIAHDLFTLIPADAQIEVQATFLELLGNKARDLMSASDAVGDNVEIREDEVRPAVPLAVTSRSHKRRQGTSTQPCRAHASRTQRNSRISSCAASAIDAPPRPRATRRAAEAMPFSPCS